MIWKRLKQVTPEQEEEFRQRMTEEEVGWKDKLTMIGTAYLIIVLPCLLILLGLSALCMWLFGVL